MKFRDPDSAAREYLRLRGILGSPKAQRLTVTAGEKPADFCPGCKGIESFVGKDKDTGSELLRCLRCGRPWPIVTAEVPRQRVDGGTKGGTETRLAELATLGTILSRLGVWERRLLLLVAPGDLSLDRVEAECRRRWPWRAEPWSLYRIRGDLGAAREKLEKLLRRRGLLEE